MKRPNTFLKNKFVLTKGLCPFESLKRFFLKEKGDEGFPLIFGVLLFFWLLKAQPLQNRILIASSLDGLFWQRMNIILVDSGDVPDAVIGPDGRVYAYFQGLWTHYTDGIMVGISSDGINDWEFHPIPIPGTETWPGRPCDPDVIVQADTFRLYFTGDPINDRQPETYSAISLDGLNFTLENGVRFEVFGSPVLDPSLLWTNDTLQYFAGGAPPGENWHAHSVDGLNFIQQANFNADGCMMANGIRLPSGGFRFYIFSNNPNNPGIRSIYSLDGRDWTIDSGYRLQLDTTNGLESRYVKDPAVVFKDSIYLMYYVTRKPPATINDIDINNLNGLLKISPNPCPSVLKIEVPECLLPNFSKGVVLCDIAGRRIKYLPIKTTVNILDISDLREGVYFLAYKLVNSSKLLKFTVLR
jgi:hypothetical protein|uniref:T9SS type A sorting domain-containing protein n=1 Tax=candidate division WOR-3 bacterium TaxID=2052148 RepID=A0A7C6A9S4_UNCW3